MADRVMRVRCAIRLKPSAIEGKSAFPENHPLSLGVRGSLAENFLRKSDVLFAIGSSERIQSWVDSALAELVALAELIGAPVALLSTSPEREDTILVRDPFDDFYAQFFGYNRFRPREVRQTLQSLGSGFIIDPAGYIITNQHVVERAADLKIHVTAHDGKTYRAHYIAGDDKTDLAFIKIDAQTDFPFINLDDISPNLLGQTVMVVGNAVGYGSSISRGVLSAVKRNITVEETDYKDLVQTDAAINPGNSGGPAIVNDEIVGVAFSHLQMAQNIGYIIPVEEIELFLQDIADGHYDGKPTMYDDLQTLENPALRSYLHLPESLQGMVVHRPFDSAASYPLKEWDVITKIGDVPVDDEGMIKLGDTLRVRFPYMVQKLPVKDTVPLTVFRGGKELKINLPVLRQRPLVIPELKGSYPSYFVYGPIVFSEATTDLIALAQRNRETSAIVGMLTYIGSPLITRIGDKPAFPGERLVVVPCPFFPHRLSKGYGNPGWQVLQTVNHQPIKNLAHLVEVLRDLKDEFVTFEFNTRSSGEAIVFPRAEMVSATENILNDNGVRSQGSTDVMKIWTAKTTGR